MDLFENLQVFKESIKTIIKRDNSVVDENQPAKVIKFYNNDVCFGEASVCYNPDSSNNFLYNVEIYEKYRGKGLSHIMIDYMIDKFNISELYVNGDNDITINLYKSHGFEIIDEFKDDDEIKYVMQRMEE